MADEAPQPTPYEQIQAQLNQLTQGLGQAFQNVDARLQQVAQVAAKGAQPPQPQKKTPEVSIDAANAQLLEVIGTNPLRYSQEVISTAKQEAVNEIMQKLEQERMTAAQQAQERAFWDGFVQYNGDMAPFMPLVFDQWQRMGGIPDPSARADEAAKQVRALIAQQRADAIEAERRQRQGQRMVSMPPGFPMPQTGGDGQEQAPRDARERLADIMQEHQQRRAATDWSNIATKKYHEEAQARARETRIVRQRVA